MIFINLKESATESNDQNLKGNNYKAYDPEKLAGTNSVEEIKLILYPPAANEIEHLKKHKGVENESKVTWVIMILFIPNIVVFTPRNRVQFTVSHSTLNYSIIIFGFKIWPYFLVEPIFEFGNKVRTDKKQDQEHNKLENRLA